MTAAALVALGVAAVAPGALAWKKIPHWLSPSVAVVTLVVGAILATEAPPVRGFALGATLFLSAGAAVFGGVTLAPSAFRIARWHATPAATPPPNSDGPLHGGLVIGLLERAAVAVAVLTARPDGLAIALAVKSLARYPELRDPKAAEQFIIGTFTSVLWAVAAAGIGRGLLT